MGPFWRAIGGGRASLSSDRPPPPFSSSMGSCLDLCLQGLWSLQLWVEPVQASGTSGLEQEQGTPFNSPFDVQVYTPNLPSFHTHTLCLGFLLFLPFLFLLFSTLSFVWGSLCACEQGSTGTQSKGSCIKHLEAVSGLLGSFQRTQSSFREMWGVSTCGDSWRCYRGPAQGSWNSGWGPHHPPGGWE